MSNATNAATWAIVVEAPHVCVWPEAVDTPCDMRTDDFARRLHAVLRTMQYPNDIIDLHRRGAPRFDLYLLESDVPRIVCDLNRSACAGEAYRARLRHIVERYAPRALVVDVHSFQNDTDWLAAAAAPPSRGARHRDAPPTRAAAAAAPGVRLQQQPDVVLLDIDAAPHDAERTAALETRAVAHRVRSRARVWRASEHDERVLFIGLLPTGARRRVVEVARTEPLVYVLAGAADNDIMREVRRDYGARCVLLEVRQGLSGASLDSVLRHVAAAVVSVVDGSDLSTTKGPRS